MQWIRQLASRLTQSRVARQRGAERGKARRPLMLEAMEPRLLLSATAGVDADGLLTILGSGNLLTDDENFVLTEVPDGTEGATIRLDLGAGDVRQWSGVKSILLKAGTGNDVITVASAISLEGSFKVYGNVGGAPTLTDDPGIDSVFFKANVSTNGGLLEVFADHIEVDIGFIFP